MTDHIAQNAIYTGWTADHIGENYQLEKIRLRAILISITQRGELAENTEDAMRYAVGCWVVALTAIILMGGGAEQA